MISFNFQTKGYEGLSDEELVGRNTANFIDAYTIRENSDTYNVLLGTYFAFTTLSTVGFGDIAPQSDPERLIWSFVLLIGVAVFSVVLGDFMAILEAYKAINVELDESDSLDSFFMVMQHFNSDVPLNFEYQLRLRQHFRYRWEKDMNQFINDPAHAELLD